MLAILLWIVFTVISSLILYAIIIGAINHSDLSTTNSEARNMSHQLNRQHQEMMNQMDDLKQLLVEQNILFREIKSSLPQLNPNPTKE